MLNFICPFLQSRTMKLIPVILSIILAGSTMGYGMQASAQQIGAASPGSSSPCTASQPCVPICGNHICKPGEVPGQALVGSNANTTKAVSQNTNQTGGPNIATQMNISANATATKTVNGTMMQGNMTMGTPMHQNGTMTGSMANGTMTGNMANGAMASNMNSMPMASALPSPNAQVAAGTQPANVKCMSGFYLVINNANSRPACVTQSTASLLEERGWGHAG
jgi:hypothetical protein